MSDLIAPTRRGFVTGLLSLVAAPAIVQVHNIMPVRSIARLLLPQYDWDSFIAPEGMFYQWNSVDPIDTLHQPIGWVPVPASRYRDIFAVGGDTIRIGNSILMEKPRAMVKAEFQYAIDAFSNAHAEFVPVFQKG
jgi:hypothetical protein